MTLVRDEPMVPEGYEKQYNRVVSVIHWRAAASGPFQGIVAGL